jgi:hypothetical protein
MVSTYLFEQARDITLNYLGLKNSRCMNLSERLQGKYIHNFFVHD